MYFKITDIVSPQITNTFLAKLFSIQFSQLKYVYRHGNCYVPYCPVFKWKIQLVDTAHTSHMGHTSLGSRVRMCRQVAPSDGGNMFLVTGYQLLNVVPRAEEDGRALMDGFWLDVEDGRGAGRG